MKLSEKCDQVFKYFKNYKKEFFDIEKEIEKVNRETFLSIIDLMIRSGYTFANRFHLEIIEGKKIKKTFFTNARFKIEIKR